jgi:hypothetical protein
MVDLICQFIDKYIKEKSIDNFPFDSKWEVFLGG